MGREKRLGMGGVDVIIRHFKRANEFWRALGSVIAKVEYVEPGIPHAETPNGDVVSRCPMDKAIDGT